MASRISSTGVTITVAPPSALAIAASTLPSNTFTAFQSASLSTRTNHPTSGIPCDVTEDGSQFVGHTLIDWAGKGIYDPQSRRVMLAACGAGNNTGGGSVYNTHSIYDETTNSWAATRGFRAANQAANCRPLGHLYDNNCVSLKARRFYKKQFTDDSGFGSGPIHQFNLDTNSWGNLISAPPGDNNALGNGAMDAIETRGSNGALWYASNPNGDTRTAIWEYNIAGGAWAVILAAGSFPALAATGGNGWLLSYNPRANAGVGGVLLAGGNRKSYVIACGNLGVAQVASDAPTILDVQYDGHLCRDPGGSGWLLFAQDGFVYRCDGSSWTRRTALPSGLAGGAPFIVVPVDAYGVVWVIRSQGTATRAWIYRS